MKIAAAALVCLIAATVVGDAVRAGDLPFRVARPGYAFRFPRDHGAHPEFRTEWWYYTGHLAAEGDGGARFGFQLTFFRSGVARPDAPRASGWALRDVYLAHLTVTDLGAQRFHMAERMMRDAIDLAGADTTRYRVWVEDWQAALESDGTHRLMASEPGSHGLDLDLRPLKSPALHGEAGLSRKGAAPHQTSHYYSITRLEAVGSIRIGERSIPVRGQAWMDHEFTTGELDTSLAGWDWFGLQLDDGSELMLYLLRRSDGGRDSASSGSFVDRAGGVTHLAAGDFAVEVERRWKSAASKAIYPMGWRIQIPGEGIELQVESLLDEQELDTSASTGVTYWEGAVKIRGTRRGVPLGGRGYVELTGYAARFRAPM